MLLLFLSFYFFKFIFYYDLWKLKLATYHKISGLTEFFQ